MGMAIVEFILIMALAGIYMALVLIACSPFVLAYMLWRDRKDERKAR